MYLLLALSCRDVPEKNVTDSSFEILYEHEEWYAVGYTNVSDSLWLDSVWISILKDDLIEVDANIILLFDSKENTPVFGETLIDVRDGNFLERHFFYRGDSTFYSNDTNIFCVYKKETNIRKSRFCYGGLDTSYMFRLCE